MKTIVLTAFAAMTCVAAHAADLGKPAPSIDTKDVKGAAVSLAGHQGKVVVLEWVNFDCPFVKKHYGSGNMQKLQADYAAKGVVWISVSTAGKNPLEASKMAELASSKGSKASHFIQDSGAIGKSYGAKTTPHLFIVDKEGKLVYDGAIDSKATPDAEDLKTADKLFANALDAVLAGKEVANAKNPPYGCGVKY